MQKLTITACEAVGVTLSAADAVHGNLARQATRLLGPGWWPLGWRIIFTVWLSVAVTGKGL